MAQDEVDRYLPDIYDPSRNDFDVPAIEVFTPFQLDGLMAAERPDLGLTDIPTFGHQVSAALRSIVDYMVVDLSSGILALMEDRGAAMRALAALAPDLSSSHGGGLDARCTARAGGARH